MVAVAGVGCAVGACFVLADIIYVAYPFDLSSAATPFGCDVAKNLDH
jgi:hypothetical protein